MRWLHLLPLFPLLSFLVLLCLDCRRSTRGVSLVGLGGTFLSLLCVALGLSSGSGLWFDVPITWQRNVRRVLPIEPKICWTLQLDQLSLAVGLVIIGVGLLVQLYAVWYMRDDVDRANFFAYTNLSVCSALLLTLADNLLLMFLGWEVIGFCSYLLIDFRPDSGEDHSAALESFVVTRMSDVFLMIAMLMLFERSGTLNFHELLTSLPADLPRHSTDLINLMLLLGVLGKSAQIPVHFWLPTAMTAPTPTSALIHAVVGVTSGVYLIVRARPLLVLSPQVLRLTSWIGALTLLSSGLSALSEKNAKRILAHSTAGQLGCMFLSAGTGIWSGAVAHMMAHAFCKSLLFLTSGSVEPGREQISGTRNLNVSAYLILFSHLIGSASLAALPLTAGFYSKTRVLSGVLRNGDATLFAVVLAGTLLTPVYVLRMFFLLLRGDLKRRFSISFGNIPSLSLVVLSILSTCVGGFLVHSLTAPLSILDGVSGGTSGFIFHAAELFGFTLGGYLYAGGGVVRKIRGRSTAGDYLSWYLQLPGAGWLCRSVFVRLYLHASRLLRSDPARLLIESSTSLLGHPVSVWWRRGQRHWNDDLVLVGFACTTIFLLVKGLLQGESQPL